MIPAMPRSTLASALRSSSVCARRSWFCRLSSSAYLREQETDGCVDSFDEARPADKVGKLRIETGKIDHEQPEQAVRGRRAGLALCHLLPGSLPPPAARGFHRRPDFEVQACIIGSARRVLTDLSKTPVLVEIFDFNRQFPARRIWAFLLEDRLWRRIRQPSGSGLGELTQPWTDLLFRLKLVCKKGSCSVPGAILTLKTYPRSISRYFRIRMAYVVTS